MTNLGQILKFQTLREREREREGGGRVACGCPARQQMARGHPSRQQPTGGSVCLLGAFNSNWLHLGRVAPRKDK